MTFVEWYGNEANFGSFVSLLCLSSFLIHYLSSLKAFLSEFGRAERYPDIWHVYIRQLISTLGYFDPLVFKFYLPRQKVSDQHYFGLTYFWTCAVHGGKKIGQGGTKMNGEYLRGDTKKDETKKTGFEPRLSCTTTQALHCGTIHGCVIKILKPIEFSATWYCCKGSADTIGRPALNWSSWSAICPGWPDSANWPHLHNK